MRTRCEDDKSKMTSGPIEYSGWSITDRQRWGSVARGGAVVQAGRVDDG